MSWPYFYTAYIWPPFLTVLLLITLSLYSWRRRSVPGALPFMIGCLFAALWVTGAILEYAAVDVATKTFWVRFQTAWQLPAVTAVTCFILEYTWPGRWLTRRNLALLSIPPLLLLGLILTNDLHHLVWTGFDFDGTVIRLHGLGGWFFVAYAYALGLVELIVFTWLFLRSPQHRWPVVIMATGQIVTRTIYILEAVDWIHFDLPLDTFFIAFLFSMYAIALFGFRILDPIALSRQMVIAQMHEGVLVLDPQERVASLNPAAEQILQVQARRVNGRPIRELLPAYPEGPIAEPGETEIELSLGTGEEVHYYRLVISELKDWRGLEAGRLLLLHDVSEQKRAQAQILEQQRALATLHERERLARELHDNIGQVLGYVSIQAQAIQKRMRDGEHTTAETQLARLAEIAQEAHKDVRESILSLKSEPGEQWAFFPALHQHLNAYQEQYSIHTDMVIPAGVSEDAFTPGTGVQLLRVIQEALTNARKHGHASCVQVFFELQDDQVKVTVVDNGRGFDLEQHPESMASHFGLAFMHERMTQVGGHLAIESQPGVGTRVVLHVPVEE